MTKHREAHEPRHDATVALVDGQYTFLMQAGTKKKLEPGMRVWIEPWHGQPKEYRDGKGR